jgi:hypothetical protein
MQMKLIEMFLSKGRIIESDQTKLPPGVLRRGVWPICNIGELNQNNRVYEKEVWEKVGSDPSIKQKMENRTLYGQAEHPKETQSDLQLTSHIVTGMSFEPVNEAGKEYERAFQNIDVLDTPCGRIVNTLMEAGCQVGVSTRAEGDLEEKEDDDGNKFQRVIPESYNYVTTDFTADPSTFGTVPMKVESNLVKEVVEGVHIKDSKKRISKSFATGILENLKGKEAKAALEELAKEKQCKGHEKCVCAQCGKCAEESTDESEPMTLEHLVNKELIAIGAEAVIRESGKKGKVTAINEGNVTINLEDGTTISLDASTVTTDSVEITLPGGGAGEELPPDIADELESEEPAPDEEIEPEAEEEVDDIFSPAEEEKPPFESKEKTDESKMGVDYVKSAKASMKGATGALKDKDFETAAQHLDDVADDAQDAAKACRKMDRERDRKDAEDKAKEKEKTKESKINEDEKPKVQLVGQDGNAFSILGRCQKAARRAGWSKEQIEEFRKEAMSDDYDHLLQTVMRYFDANGGDEEDEYESIKPQKESIVESFDHMVDYLRDHIKSLPNNITKKLRTIVSSKALNENATSMAKQIRQLKIKEASSRAERDKSVEILTQVEDDLKASVSGLQVESRILMKRLKERNLSTEEVTALCTMVEEKSKKIKELTNRMSKNTLEFGKHIKENDQKILEIEESYKNKIEEETKEIKERLQKEFDKKFISEYITVKVSQSGLRVPKSSRALLEKCESVEEVDKTLEEVREGLKLRALRPKKIDGITEEKVKEKSPDEVVIETRVKSSMQGMGIG